MIIERDEKRGEFCVGKRADKDEEQIKTIMCEFTVNR